ncbi:hypothetical protein [Aurantiacibacter marinus]|nr:hypothetical protein [Aurantiacibacter marinus]
MINSAMGKDMEMVGAFGNSLPRISGIQCVGEVAASGEVAD